MAVLLSKISSLVKKWCLWEDSAGAEDTVLKATSKDGLIVVYNAWDTGKGCTEAWWGGAAMMIEEIPDGKRYYCNDGHPDEDFDDLIFEIEVIKS